MAGELSTIKTTLEFGTTADNLTKLCAIKDYPDLGGEPEMLEVTDLDDNTQRFIPGVQTIGAMAFTANYTPEAYDAVAATERTPGYYALKFGEDGADGIFEWQGQHVVYVAGGGVNAPREMRIVIAPTTKVTKRSVE